jgi:hypothetical protein
MQFVALTRSVDTRLNSLNSDGTTHAHNGDDARCTTSRSTGIRASSEDSRFECLGGLRCLFQSDNDFRRSSVPEVHVIRDLFCSFFSDRCS